MASVRILGRTAISGLVQSGLTSPAVAVTYAAERLAPRVVQVDGKYYREATADELATNRNYTVYPHDDEGQQAELTAIQDDIARASRETPITLELP